MKRLQVEPGEVLFLSLLALLTTVLDYRFGFGNQTEQLPLVLHAIDPAVLAHDFYVKSAEGFGPRFYYVGLLSTLARLAPLPVVVFLLALLVNAAVGAVSHFAARDLLRADRLGGFLAATLVLSVGSFPTGLVTDIRFLDFQPGSLAIPGCLAALWAGLRGRPLLAGGLAALSSLPHPLYGVESGALALGAAGVVALLGTPARASLAERVRPLLPTAGGAVVLGSATLLFWGLPWAGVNPEPLPDAEFIAVLSFRSPHHYLPGVFPIAHYVLLLAFVAACAHALRVWHQEGGSWRESAAFASVPLAVLGLCAGGILFVEVWPSRLWITAQPFRLLYLLKWQGLLVLAWLLAGWIRERRLPRSALAWIALLGSGAAQPLIAAGSLAAERLDARLRQARPDLPTWLLPAIAALAALALLIPLGKPREALALIVASIAAMALSAARPRRGVALPLVGAVVLFAGVNHAQHWTEWEPLLPIASFADHRGDEADAGRWAGVHLPEDAVFLVPPGMGSFRLLARRAVIVDFKALPFAERALREWKARMEACYGPVEGGGFPALARMDRNHRGVSDTTLDAIAKRFAADFAVLYAETETRRRVLYRNDRYKIVAL